MTKKGTTCHIENLKRYTQKLLCSIPIFIGTGCA